MKEYLQQLQVYKQKIKDWWQPLATREKQAIVIGGSLLGLFIVYQCIWSPVLNHNATMRSNIVTKQKTLLWMQAADKEINKIAGHTTNKVKAVSPVALLGYLQKQIQHAGLESNLTQLKQASNDTIALHFQKVEFDKLIKLITTICKEQSVSIAQMSAVAENTPGIVNVDVMIKIG